MLRMKVFVIRGYHRCYFRAGVVSVHKEDIAEGLMAR